MDAADFSHADLRDLRFFGSDLSGSDFSSSQLNDVVLQYCVAARIKFDRSQIVGFSFEQSMLMGLQLGGATIANSILDRTRFAPIQSNSTYWIGRPGYTTGETLAMLVALNQPFIVTDVVHKIVNDDRSGPRLPSLVLLVGDGEVADVKSARIVQSAPAGYVCTRSLRTGAQLRGGSAELFVEARRSDQSVRIDRGVGISDPSSQRRVRD